MISHLLLLEGALYGFMERPLIIVQKVYIWATVPPLASELIPLCLLSISSGGPEELNVSQIDLIFLKSKFSLIVKHPSDFPNQKPMTCRLRNLPCPIYPISQEVYTYYLLNIFQIHFVSPTTVTSFIQALITSFLDIVLTISHHESFVRAASYLSHSLRSVTGTKKKKKNLGWMNNWIEKRVLFLVLTHNLFLLYSLSWMSFSLFFTFILPSKLS